MTDEWAAYLLLYKNYTREFLQVHILYAII